MIFLELYHLRHAQRIGKNPHISEEGLKKAQEIGKNLPTFDTVLSSASIRSIETTIAMGYAITDTIDFKDAVPKVASTEEEQQGFDTFIGYFHSINNSPYFKEFNTNLVTLLTNKLSPYKSNDRILLVSHGGVIETSTIGFLPSLNYSEWGSNVIHCHGVKLLFKDGKCISGEKI